MPRSSQLTFTDAKARKAQGPALTVLPDAVRVEEHVVRKAAPFAPGHLACTFADLEREVVRAARGSGACGRIATPETLALALRDACRTAAPPYARIREQSGFARAAQDLLAALSRGMLEPKALLALVPSLPAGTWERISSLADILCTARRRLEERGLVDAGGALLRGVAHLEEGGELPRKLAAAGSVVFEWIDDWSPIRVRLVLALAARMGPGRVRVRLPWPSGDRSDLREVLDPVLRGFEASGGAQAAPEIELREPEEPSALAPFLRRLFGTGAPERDDRVVLRACASPAAQAREAAKRCVDLLALGAAPDGIAIVARDLGGGVLEELTAALDRFRVPWRERRGSPAATAPPVRLALSLYDLVERRFPVEGVETLLCSRLVWLREEGDRVPPERLVRRLREARIVDDVSEGGYDARLVALADRISAKAAAAAGEGRAAPDPVRARAEIDEVRRRVRRILDEASALPERASLRDHGAALLALLDRWQLPARIRRHDDSAVEADFLSRASAAALGRDQAALDALEGACGELARAADALGESDRLRSRAEWVQALSGALTALRPGGARGGAVQICQLGEVPGRRFEHLIITNLVEGQLPATPPVDPLLADEDRRAVNRLVRRPVFDLPGTAQEPLLFHLALCAADASIALLWPRRDERGRETVRSPFVDEAARALGLSAEEQRAAESPLSPIPRLADCRTTSEAIARASLECLADPALRVSEPAPREATLALAAAICSSAAMPKVARAALAERERIRALVQEAPPGRFSGQLSGAALELLQPIVAFQENRPLSSRSLDEYATCGFRTFGRRVLGIEEGEESSDDLSMRDRGGLAHRCLERFFVRLAEEGRLPLRGTAEELETLREVAEEEMDAFALREHVGRRSLWAIRRKEVLRDLAAVLEAEATEEGLPRHFEKAFGYPHAWEPLRIPSADGAGEVFVRGLIDRIDELEDGSLVVLDYKSGSLDTLSRKLDPASLLKPEFQLAIYLALVRQLHPGRAVDAAFVSLRKARRTATMGDKTGVDLDRLLELDPARRARIREEAGPPLNLADEVWKAVQKQRGGLFPVDPISCDYCDLQPTCRLVALPTDPEENGSEVRRG
ncbi:MAG: PD-(D/E)XK nuclease family protein [Myxococcales bacterium]